MFGDLFWIALVNPGFWIILVLSFGYPIYKKATSPLLYSWKEFSMQLFGGFVALILIYMIFFKQTTDIANSETINTRVISSEYHEPWTERVTRTECSGNKPRTCKTETYYIHHAAEYVINGANGHKIDTNLEVYIRYKDDFGSAKEYIHRGNQSSYGDGNKYVSKPNTQIPMSYTQEYVDYIKASHTTILKDQYKRQYSDYANRIISYPSIMNSRYGEIDAVRLVGDAVNIIKSPPMEKGLDFLNMEHGENLQSNIIVYATHEKSQRFISAILNLWNAPRQNDILIFVSVDNNNTIRWVDVKAFTKHELFKTGLETKILQNKYFNESIIPIIDKQLKNPADEEDGFLREKMENYEYLRGSISLAWYWNLLIFITFLAAHYTAARYFENDDSFN